MRKIQGGAKSYAWGKVGHRSLVAKFLGGQVEEIPYAEYWLGTHPSSPAFIVDDHRGLRELTGELGYLFKVLCIGKPLSIQVHPDKQQAESLHQESPELYRDSNHKPELFLALSVMRVLYGFKPLEEVSLLNVPELQELIKDSTTLENKVKRLFEDENRTIAQVTRYINRIESSCADPLSLELHAHFPYDIGIFFAMLMQYIEVPAGSGLAIHPRTPHCYIEGECIEVMACSDNVLRAGLTQKHRDVQNLLSVVDYTCTVPPDILTPAEVTDGVLEVKSEYSEFKLLVFEGSGEVAVPATGVGVVFTGSVATAEGGRLVEGTSFAVTEHCTVTLEGARVYFCGSNS